MSPLARKRSATLNLSKQLDQWIGLVLPFQLDAQARPSVHAVLNEMEARRLSTGQITLMGGKIVWDCEQ